MSPKPTELAICLAALPGRYSQADGWVSADEISFRLRYLDSTPYSAQQVAARAKAMCSLALLERSAEQAAGNIYMYRVTPKGTAWIGHELPSVSVRRPS